MTDPIRTTLPVLSATGPSAAVRGLSGQHTLAATIVGTAAVSFTAAWEGSNDLVGWTPIGSVTASGTGVASASVDASRDFAYWRLNASALSGGVLSAVVASELASGGTGGSQLTAAELATFRASVSTPGNLSIPSRFYRGAYRGAQPDFGPLLDISAAAMDAATNTDVWPAGYSSTATYTANAYVSPSVPNGYVYRVTTAPGSAAGTEPATWTTTVGGTSSSGGGTVFTCERGPYYLDNGIRQFRSLANAMFTPTTKVGSIRLPKLTWDMAAGDSLIVNVSGAFNFTNGGHGTQNLSEAIVLGNCRPAGAASRKGFRMFATGQTSFNDLRLSIFDGTTARVAAHLASGASNKPGDGSRHTSTYFIDGQTKRGYLVADGQARSNANDYTGVTASDLVYWHADLSAVTGSTQSDAFTFLGATPATTGDNSAATTYEFGAARVDIMTLPGRGLPANIIEIGQWFHNRGEGLLPDALLV